MNAVLRKLSKVGRRARGQSGITTTIWLGTGKRRSIHYLSLCVLPIIISPSRSHCWLIGWSVLGGHHVIYHRVLPMAPARPNRSHRSTPFPDRRAVRRDFEPNRASNSQPVGFPPRRLGCRHQHFVVFQSRVLIGRRSPLHSCQTVDTRVYAIYPYLLARGHLAAAIPVRRVEELGREGSHHVSSDSPGGSTRVLPHRTCRSPMDLAHYNGCYRHCIGRRHPPLLPRNPHSPRIFRRRLRVSDTYFLGSTEIAEMGNVASDDIRCGFSSIVAGP